MPLISVKKEFSLFFSRNESGRREAVSQKPRAKLASTSFKASEFSLKKFLSTFSSTEGVKFDNQLKSIFNEELSLEGLSYILMANDMIHSVKPNAIIIATDNSHYPFLARPIRDGGLGFDYQTEPDHISVSDFLFFSLQKKKKEENKLEIGLKKKKISQLIAHSIAHHAPPLLTGKRASWDPSSKVLNLSNMCLSSPPLPPVHFTLLRISQISWTSSSTTPSTQTTTSTFPASWEYRA